MKDYSKFTYVVSSRQGFGLTEALSLWKAKYPEYIDFEKDVIVHETLKDFGIFVKECWDDVIPVSVEDGFSQDNTELRRIYFDCIGVQKLFEKLDPVLRDRQVISKKRMGWDDDNQEIEKVFDDVYELYEMPGEKLFGKDRWGNAANSIFAVRCWCTTTNREYWIYVNEEAATGQRWSRNNAEYNAIRAIAWTIRIDVPDDNLERIYRQGDIIVAKMKVGAKITESTISPYHISEQQYLKLMYSET